MLCVSTWASIYYLLIFVYTIKNNFMAPFYGWGSTASRLEPLRGDSLLFTTKFLEATLVNQTAKNRILFRTCSSTDPQSNIWEVSNNICHISHCSYKRGRAYHPLTTHTPPLCMSLNMWLLQVSNFWKKKHFRTAV